MPGGVIIDGAVRVARTIIDDRFEISPRVYLMNAALKLSAVLFVGINVVNKIFKGRSVSYYFVAS